MNRRVGTPHVFGGSAKAARVVPNEVVDRLACGAAPWWPKILRQGANCSATTRTLCWCQRSTRPALVAALRRLRDGSVRERLAGAALCLCRRRLTPTAVGDSLLAAPERLA